MRFDIAHKVATKLAYATGAMDAAAANDSAILDTKGYSAVALMLMLGTMTTAGTAVVTFEHGDDSGGADFVAVPAAEIVGKTTLVQAEDANGLARIGYLGIKRYLQATITLNDVTVISGTGVWVLGVLDSALQDKLPSDVLPTA